MHRSVATQDVAEFVNLQPLDLNPLMSSCEIKVMYVGENRNRSFISKEVATDMAKSLRGCPIVGYFKEEKQDFADHGQRMTIDDEGIHFECMTRPYGFVAPDAKVWFKKFEDYDEFGNSEVHEYLMTEGYLWTGQFEECKAAVTEGRPHSMELDEETLNGHWSENIKSGIEFFIINDAIFSKLCILGEDTEPCFEGSSVASHYSLDGEFKNTLYSMMNDIKNFTLQGGQQQMENVKDIQETGVDFTEEVETVVEETEVVEAPADEFKKQDEEEKKEDNGGEPADDSKGSTEEENSEEEDDEKKKPAKNTLEEEHEEPAENFQAKYEALEQQFKDLQSKFTSLNESYNELCKFKNDIEIKEKDELIDSFYMLSDEDKANVIAKKNEYTLDDIEKELSVICYRKKVSFAPEKEQQVVTTFNVNTVEEESVPELVEALREAHKKNKEL